jgi:formylglycine-generating enzyme required for sulfatase activity
MPNSQPGGAFEPGWDATGWNNGEDVDPTDAHLGSCNSSWTDAPGTRESWPMACVTWHEAYAFCIWDGGFLPGEAELNYAAMGGSDERPYPWSTSPTDETIACAYANYAGCLSPINPNVVGSESPLGDGLWGQSDLAGNLWEWQQDLFDTYTVACIDCADTIDPASSTRTVRGGGFLSVATRLLTSTRDQFEPTTRYGDLGFRCARTP